MNFPNMLPATLSFLKPPSPIRQSQQRTHLRLCRSPGILVMLTIMPLWLHPWSSKPTGAANAFLLLPSHSSIGRQNVWKEEGTSGRQTSLKKVIR